MQKIMIKQDCEVKYKRQCCCEARRKNNVSRDARFKMATEKAITNITVQNWRSKTADSKLRRFYEGLDCARLFNTRYLLDYTSVDLRGSKGRLALSIVCHIGNEKAKIVGSLCGRISSKASCEGNDMYFIQC